MKLWRISQTENDYYDFYDSAIVAAESEEEAKMINPEGGRIDSAKTSYSWVNSPDEVTAEYIGEAAEGITAGDVICASFNAG